MCIAHKSVLTEQMVSVSILLRAMHTLFFRVNVIFKGFQREILCMGACHRDIMVLVFVPNLDAKETVPLSRSIQQHPRLFILLCCMMYGACMCGTVPLMFCCRGKRLT